MSITAIETRYAGHLFRSRLEARWAVFFDRLGIAWEYEPQGYVLGNGESYLPDFWLPGLHLWVEVKGTVNREVLATLGNAAAANGLPLFRHDERRPCDWPTVEWPATASGMSRLLLLGDVPRPDDSGWIHPMLLLCRGTTVAIGGVYFWGRSRTFNHGCTFRVFGQDPISVDPDEHLPNGSRHPALKMCDPVAAAYQAARSARFEHGQSGAQL